jgi:hypothetical protein
MYIYIHTGLVLTKPSNHPALYTDKTKQHPYSQKKHMGKENCNKLGGGNKTEIL